MRSCRITRLRDAPMTARTDSSRARACPRASSRFATFAQATRRTIITTTAMVFNGSRKRSRVSCCPRDPSSTASAGSSPATKSGFDAAVVCFRIRSSGPLTSAAETPSRRRPTIRTHQNAGSSTDSSLRATSDRAENGKKTSGASTTCPVPRNPAGPMPMMVNGMPLTLMERPIVSAEPPKRLRQKLWLIMAAAGASVASSPGPSVRLDRGHCHWILVRSRRSELCGRRGCAGGTYREDGHGIARVGNRTEAVRAEGRSALLVEVVRAPRGALRTLKPLPGSRDRRGPAPFRLPYR